MPAPPLACDGPEDAALTVVLAHGAGAPMDSPFMAFFAEGLARHGHRVCRFEFPYMARRRETGVRSPPDRAGVLLGTWRAVIASLTAHRLVIGGKSLGGRMASMIADEAGADGLVCLGYPFHAPGKSVDPGRVAHLASVQVPTLILQGSRDPFGTPGEVDGYALSKSVRVHWLDGADHGLAPSGASGRSAREMWTKALTVLAGFLETLPANR